MPSNEKLIADLLDWLEDARPDSAIASADPRGARPAHLCFHAQQCAEQALKALIFRRGAMFPALHDPLHSVRLVRESGYEPPLETSGAKWLTRFAVFNRYPLASSSVTSEEQASALATEQAVFGWAQSILT